MDTETLVSPSPPKAPITILQSQENGSDDGDSSSHVGEDDDFETASESDAEEHPAVKAAPLLPKAAMPIAKVTADDELDENPSQEEVDGDGPDGRDDILGGEHVSGVKTNGNLEGLDEEEGSASAEGGGKSEDLADIIHSFVEETSVVEEPLEGKYDILGGEAEVEKEGVAEAPVAVEGGEETQEQSTVEVDAVEGVPNVSPAEENVDVDVHAAVEKQDVLNKEVDETAEGESNVVEAEENEDADLHAALEEAKAVERELDKVVEIKAVDRESNVAKAEKNEAADVHAAEEPKAVDGELEEVLEGESNVVEFNENVAAELHSVEEPRAVERALDENGQGESSVPEVNENEAADLHASTGDPKAIEREVTDVESDNVGDVAEVATTDRSLEMESVDVKVVPGSYQGPADSEAMPEDVESVSIVADDSKSEEGEREASETSALPGPYQAPTDLEAKPVHVGSLPMKVEGSESKETEVEILVTPGVSKNDDTRGVSGDSLSSVLVDQKVEDDADAAHAVDDDENWDLGDAEEDDDGTVSDQPPRVAILDSSETAKQIIREMEGGSSSTSSISGFESSRDFQHQVDGQIVSDSDEEADTDEEGDGKELFDSAALAALLKAATGGSSDGNITITSQDGTRSFSVDRPAGLGNAAPVLRPAPARSIRPTFFNPSVLAVSGEPENDMDEEEKKLRDKIDAIRVKFLRLVMRLGNTPEDNVAAHVLDRLGLAEGIRRGRRIGRAFTNETAKKKASELESEGKELEFSCNLLVLGKIGVGKSATINSIFGEDKCRTSAFLPGTTSVREISGIVDGVKIRVVDTPGLRSSVMDQTANRKILSSIKSYMKRCPPDIVLYVDRIDTQTRDFNDLPLLKSITSTLGSSVWFNAIIALTHAASAPPDGPSGSPLDYEAFIKRRSQIVQQSIRQSTGDMRLPNPVALVENHPSCRRNREGQRVLPNGLNWRHHMLLLCYSSKILSEANTLLNLQDSSPPKLFGHFRRSPPLPYLLSTLLQTRQHPKLSTDQGGDNGDSDIDLDDFSDSDEEEDEYDQLPPFKPLKKAQIAKLTKEQKKAYFDEYDYRVRLLQKKQWKQELRRLKEMKRRGKSNGYEAAYGDMGEDYDQEGAPATVPVPLPDMVLPPSFDCEVPTYRYRFLEPTSQLLTRPVLDTHGWDHDYGYDGVSLEENLAIAGQFPTAVAVQITKDKKEFNIHLDSSVSAKHGENGSSLVGFDIQSVGKHLAYILRSETRFKNLKKNKTTAGISVTFLGETVATGLKIEDQLSLGNRVGLVASTGAIRAQGDVAYGANLEARLREKDYPIGQALSTLGLSLMKWRNDLALGANLQSQLNIGRNSKVAVRAGLNNKLSGQITVKTSSSEQLQLALVGILPLAVSVLRSIWSGESY